MRTKAVLSLLKDLEAQHTEQIKSMLAAIRPEVARPLLTPQSFTAPAPAAPRSEPPGRFVTDDTGLDSFYIQDGTPADMSAFRTPWDLLMGAEDDEE